MKFCAKCGTQLTDEAKACTQCQTPINDHCNSVVKHQNAAKKTFNKQYLIVPFIALITVVITLVAAYFILPNNTSVSNLPPEEPVIDTYVDTICTETDSGNHYWNPPNCVEPAKCFYCDEYKNNKLGNHNWQAPTCIEPSQCSFCFAYKDEKLGNHNWVNDDTNSVSCKYCHMRRSDWEQQNH